MLVVMAAMAALPGRFDEFDWHRVLDLDSWLLPQFSESRSPSSIKKPTWQLASDHLPEHAHVVALLVLLAVEPAPTDLGLGGDALEAKNMPSLPDDPAPRMSYMETPLP